ncbi:MAG TPA: hypothetical protein VL443_24115 [Cyclobacteriaceae bacterium]|jgi:hypothetical protein|nr:hypothetical protein [Cyclobacteriaceae bacterium]
MAQEIIVDETHPYPEEYWEEKPKKIKYVTKFNRIYFTNRWKIIHKRLLFDASDPVYIGIQHWYCSWDSYAIRFCFFGFEMHVWFKVEKK